MLPLSYGNNVILKDIDLLVVDEEVKSLSSVKTDKENLPSSKQLLTNLNTAVPC
jgi:hypothetical protein